MMANFALKHGERVLGYPCLHDGVVDSSQEKVAVVPAEPPPEHIRAKAHRVATDHPQDPHDGHGCKAVHHGAQDVLSPHKPTIEHGQPGNHEQDQRRRSQHPGGGAGIDLGPLSPHGWWKHDRYRKK